MTVTLEDAGCAWCVCVDGRRVATFVQWAHAMRFVEYLRTDKGRQSLDEMPPIGGTLKGT